MDSFNLRRWIIWVTAGEIGLLPSTMGGLDLTLTTAVLVLAWSIGLLWTLAPSPFIDEQTPLTVLVVVYAVAGMGMAATVALISGQGLRQFLAIQPDGSEWLDNRERVSRE